MEENKKTYSEDHVLAMFEEIKGQFMAFGEGQQILSDKLDNVNDRFIRMEGKMEIMEGRMSGVEDELKIMNSKLDNKAEKAVVEDHENRLLKLEKTSLATG